MKRFLSLFALIMLVGVCANPLMAQTEGEDDIPDKKKGKKAKRQNQENFMGDDINKDGNFGYDGRGEIHLPLMPRYDQDSASFQSGKKKQKQQDAFSDRDYYYPAKPKTAWVLGIRFGFGMVNGDVRHHNVYAGYKPGFPGYYAGVTVKKSLSYLFMIRMGASYQRSWGNDYRRTQGYDGRNFVLDNILGPGNGYNGPIYQNFRTQIIDLTFDMYLTLGNSKFHRERAKVTYNIILGTGAMLYVTHTDQLDENGDLYDYTLVDHTLPKKDIIDGLNNLRDGEYETQAENSNTAAGITNVNEYTLRPIIALGAGFTFRLTKRFSMDMDAKLNFTKDDLLDGQRWTEFGDFTNDNDTYLQAGLGINYNLLGKKKLEPLAMLNPMDYTYKKMAELDPAAILEELDKDQDEDGVPDRWDRDNNTPKDCPTDNKGVALDSDGDGCIDCLDAEPFSPPGYPIDENCVAIIPVCCDSVQSGPLPVGMELPGVYFSPDKTSIGPEYFGNLHIIGERMLQYPDMKVVATGFADVHGDSKYNEKLSWNRVQAAVDYLVEKYGISRDRFCIDYKGKEESVGGTASQDQMERNVSFRVAEEGEDCENNPADPHPGLNAGSK